jgi:hypothetical protein
MAVKVFEEKHEPLELELRDINGKSHVVKTLLITSGDLNEIELIGLRKSKKKYKTNTEQVHAMLMICCGKNQEFWSKFSINLLSDVVSYIIEENKKKQSKMDG